MRFTSLTVFAFVALSTIPAASRSAADSFSSGPNQFDIEFVTIGNPGNAADTTGSPNPAGSVAKTFRIGKFEISEQMVDMANAAGGLGITKDSRSADKPATSVSWFEAARFVNWLNADVGSASAYKFDGGGNFQLWQPGDPGYNPANLYRNSRAKYFLPSIDEWYKAAYFDASSGVYFDFPTGSDSTPDGINFTGDPVFDAVYNGPAAGPAPNDITNVGVLSPYGTAGQGGNVWEWQETTDFDSVNGSVSSSRGYRGGGWPDSFIHMRSSNQSFAGPNNGEFTVGFRVASVPEPSAVLLAAVAAIGLSSRRRVKC